MKWARQFNGEPGLDHARDFLVAESGFTQHLLRVLAETRSAAISRPRHPVRRLLLTFHTSQLIVPVERLQKESPMPAKLDLLQGTLDLMVLRTLSTLGSLHGYGIARRIEQISGDRVILNQGTIYISLVRLQQRGWIRSKWGVSDNNRRARYYAITKAGERQLIAETETWERLAAVMGRVLANGEPTR